MIKKTKITKGKPRLTQASTIGHSVAMYLRLPPEHAERLETILDAMMKLSGVDVSRHKGLLAVVERGLPAMERELGIASDASTTTAGVSIRVTPALDLDDLVDRIAKMVPDALASGFDAMVAGLPSGSFMDTSRGKALEAVRSMHVPRVTQEDAERVMQAIMGDLVDRRTLERAFHSYPEETQQEVRATWAAIALREMDGGES